MLGSFGLPPAVDSVELSSGVPLRIMVRQGLLIVISIRPTSYIRPTNTCSIVIELDRPQGIVPKSYQRAAHALGAKR